MMALTGCAADTANRGVYEKSGNTLNVNTKRTDLYHEGEPPGIRNVSHSYGYVRHQPDPTRYNTNNHYTALNREQLANVISKLGTTIPNVNDVATLVTDQEVLISYRTNSKDRNTTADQVKRTAMSVVPRYYHVYVSDNKLLMKEVENLSRSGFDKQKCALSCQPTGWQNEKVSSGCSGGFKRKCQWRNTG